MFQEGDGLVIYLDQHGGLVHEHPPQKVEQIFRKVARLSGGAYGKFDAGAARQLGELLRAVAAFAAGGAATPFFLETDPLDWPMTLREASFIAFAAKRVLRRLGLAAEGRQFKLGPSFKKVLEVVDDAEPLVVEFGLRKDGDEKDQPRVYLRIGTVLVGCNDADGYRLLGAFCRYEEADKFGPPQPVQGDVVPGMREALDRRLPPWAREF